MCYNCGCNMPADDMGKGNLSEGGSSLTDKDVEKMSKEWGMTDEETLKTIRETINQKLGDK